MKSKPQPKTRPKTNPKTKARGKPAVKKRTAKPRRSVRAERAEALAAIRSGQASALGKLKEMLLLSGERAVATLESCMSMGMPNNGPRVSAALGVLKGIGALSEHHKVQLEDQDGADDLTTTSTDDLRRRLATLRTG